jgi:hypothetical protein
LRDLLAESDSEKIFDKYGIGRGELQDLQRNAAVFGGMVSIFAQRLKWRLLGLHLSAFKDRLEVGAPQELTDLMRIRRLRVPRARVRVLVSFFLLFCLFVDLFLLHLFYSNVLFYFSFVSVVVLLSVSSFLPLR